MTEEEVSMILNTFMYLDYKEAKDGMKMKEILADLSKAADFQEGGIHYGEYQVLSKAAENPQIGELIIGNQSHVMGFDSGTAACTFREENGSTYVVYRGTGDGEWFDNGIGMTENATTQQKRALTYFETVMETGQITDRDRLIVTGHSKGGNKAQYVMMSTKYEELLDACYNIDGQGFSENAIAGWKEQWGAAGYEERINKITGIYGENDYVNVLGNSIVKEENVLYVRTPVEKSYFAGYHDIKYMFATMQENPATGEVSYVFRGEKNEYINQRGELGEWAATLSKSMMQLPEHQRRGCAAFIMQLLEMGGIRKSGLNGERMEWTDVEMFMKEGMPMVLQSLLGTGQGWKLLEGAVFEKTFSQEMRGTVLCKVDDDCLQHKSKQLLSIARKLESTVIRLEEAEKRMSVFMRGNWLLQHRLLKEKELIGNEIDKVKKLADTLSKVAVLYRSRDEETAEKLRICYSSLLK